MKLEKFSFGIGDRFAKEGQALLKAFIKAKELGVNIVPIWNKSDREHLIIHSTPEQTREEADEAVKNLDWKDNYYVDADHINIKNADKYIESSNFFTIDVADYIDKPVSDEDLEDFISYNKKHIGKLEIPGIEETFDITKVLMMQIAKKFLCAIKEAGKTYKHILEKKKNQEFITEISMDEVDKSQSPIELFFILSALSYEKVPLQTIAPKFSGEFNKGIDYSGDVQKFGKEFEEDIYVIDFAIKTFDLPDNLKLSIHSGSDKFSIFPVIGSIIKKHNKGIHVKTAGTTWIEEIIGLSLSGEEGLKLAKSIYVRAYNNADDLAKPYQTVINIDKTKLPSIEEVNTWTGEKFADTLRHVPSNPNFNSDVRQLIHISYQIAAEYGKNYTDMIDKYHEIISKQVTENIFDRHIKRIFFLE